MERYAVFLVLLASASALQPPKETKKYRDDYEFDEATNAFFKLHVDSAPYHVASRLCELEGAALMVPRSIQDIAVVHALFKQFQDIGEYVWVGDDGEVHESAEDEAMIKFSAETESDPMVDTPGRQPCLVLNREGQIEHHSCGTSFYRDGSWPDFPFVCKVDLGNAPYDSECDVYAKDYQYIKKTGSCYKLSKSVCTWNQAYSECQQEGAHLVVVNSEEESKVVKGLMSTMPLLHDAVSPYYYIAGIRCDRTADSSSRVFKTIFNETLASAGFAEWADTEPNNLSGNEFCGSLYETDGKYNDLDCDKVYGFICEKEK